MLTAEREVGTSAVGLGRRLDLGLAVSRPTCTGSLPSELAIMLTGPTSIFSEITKRGLSDNAPADDQHGRQHPRY